VAEQQQQEIFGIDRKKALLSLVLGLVLAATRYAGSTRSCRACRALHFRK